MLKNNVNMKNILLRSGVTLLLFTVRYTALAALAVLAAWALFNGFILLCEQTGSLPVPYSLSLSQAYGALLPLMAAMAKPALIVLPVAYLVIVAVYVWQEKNKDDTGKGRIML